MANIKITELNGITKKANDDVLAIVDVSADETKKIAVGDLLDKNVELIAVTDTEPAECSYGDKYFNTTDNLIYTAIATDTWSEDGEEPIEGIFYVVFGEQSSYAYNGTTLISVGGGTEDIVISDTQPISDDWKLWIDSDKLTDNTYYNDNGTPTNIKTTTFDTLPVGTEVDYDGETVPSGWTEVADKKIVWTNPNPTTSMNETTITINDISDYDSYEIIYKTWIASNILHSTGIIPKGNDLFLNVNEIAPSANVSSLNTRLIEYISTTQLKVNYGVVQNINTNGTITISSNTANTNGICLPLYVIAHKTGLYS